MAQLVKLKDYITRYEWDMYRYPSQYIRHKQTKWEKLYDLWEHPLQQTLIGAQGDETAKPSRFQRVKSFFKKSTNEKQDAQSETVTLPDTEDGLKHYFLKQLFPFQLKWATSTVTDVSEMEDIFQTDHILKYFLQRFPDTYLLMYYPIFNLKKAPVDADIILITPIGIDIIHMMEEDPGATIIAGDERTWIIENNDRETKFLSPYISLKRTEKIVKSILNASDIQFPIQKIVLSRTSPILFHTEPYHQHIIGKYEYEEWFVKKRHISSPLKHQQLSAAEALLKRCQTTSVKRPEWEEGPPSFSMDHELE